MKEFSKEDLYNIYKQSLNSNLETVLFEQYADYIVYTVISKIPMDDWDFDGAFFTKERAEKKTNEIREHCYNPYLHTEITTKKISELKLLQDFDQKIAFRTLNEHLKEIISETN